MIYEVEIKVFTKGTSGDTLRSIRRAWTFGDNENWRLAGEAYVVEKTAETLSDHIRDELKGAEAYNLNDSSGTPTKA